LALADPLEILEIGIAGRSYGLFADIELFAADKDLDPCLGDLLGDLIHPSDLVVHRLLDLSLPFPSSSLFA